MELNPCTLMLSFFLVLTLQSSTMILSYSKSIVKTLPGYDGDLPLKLETGYVGVGDKEEVQLCYYFFESTGNPEEDPLIFYFPGGPGSSAFMPIFEQIGPFKFDLDNIQNNSIRFIKNPYAWTEMANVVFVDLPAGVGFSYSESKDGFSSSDNIYAAQATEFIYKFFIEHPKLLKKEVYMVGSSYAGLIVPKITLELYEGNQREDQLSLNIQGYILTSPFTDKFKDFNSRLEYAHRMTLISDDIYKCSIKNCHGDYMDTDSTNLLCANCLHQYEQCISHINVKNILEPFCDENDPTYCKSLDDTLIDAWANSKDVQQALHIRQGKVETYQCKNNDMHYGVRKNDTAFYSYDIFTSIPYLKTLTTKNCRSLILSGDHDLTFPYVRTEQWRASLNLDVQIPWKPFYVDGEVGGYETEYVKDDYSLKFASVKGGAHSLATVNPIVTMDITQRWLSSKTYSSDS